MSDEADILIGYAIGTENDAVAMYRYMIKHLPKKYSPVLKHILKEEEEHSRELTKLLNQTNENR